MSIIPAKQIKTYSDQGDIFDSTYYDTAELVSTSVSYDLFETPLSATKKKDDTNMTDAGSFPFGKAFQIQMIGLRIFDRAAVLTAIRPGAVLNELFSLLSRATLTMNIVGKQDLGEWPVSELLGVTNLVTAPETAGDSDTAGTDNFVPQWKKLRYPINLDAQVRFSIPLTFHGVTALPSTLDNYAIQVLIKGTEQRRK